MPVLKAALRSKETLQAKATPQSKTAPRAAIEAVAKHFSAPWEGAEGAPDAYLTIRGQKIALDVGLLGPRRMGHPKPALKARLREDKVAQRVLRDLDDALRAHVPYSNSIILTLGAPIKLANKLVATLTSLLLTYLETGAADVDQKRMILGNRVRFCITNLGTKSAAKVIGFVFTGDPAPNTLAEVMRSLHDEIAAKAKGRLPKKFTGERWLILQSERWIADIKTYRRAYTLLSSPRHFDKLLLALDGGRVETLEQN